MTVSRTKQDSEAPLGRIAILDARERSRANARRAIRRMGYETDVFENMGQLTGGVVAPSQLTMVVLAGAKDSGSSMAQIVEFRAFLAGSDVPTLHLVPKNQIHDLAPLCRHTRDEVFVRLTSFGELTSILRMYMRNVHLRVPDVDWEWGRYRFLPMTNTVEFDDVSVELRTDEFDLATELFGRVGHTIARKKLCVAIWGHDGHDKSRSLDACASRLRRALQLEHHGWALRAVWGAGYRLDGPSSSTTALKEEVSFETS